MGLRGPRCAHGCAIHGAVPYHMAESAEGLSFQSLVQSWKQDGSRLRRTRIAMMTVGVLLLRFAVNMFAAGIGRFHQHPIQRLVVFVSLLIAGAFTFTSGLSGNAE